MTGSRHRASSPSRCSHIAPPRHYDFCRWKPNQPRTDSRLESVVPGRFSARAVDLFGTRRDAPAALSLDEWDPFSRTIPPHSLVSPGPFGGDPDPTCRCRVCGRHWFAALALQSVTWARFRGTNVRAVPWSPQPSPSLSLPPDRTTRTARPWTLEPVGSSLPACAQPRTCRASCRRNLALFPNGSAGVRSCTTMDAPTAPAVARATGETRSPEGDRNDMVWETKAFRFVAEISPSSPNSEPRSRGPHGRAGGR